ncbi:MAG: hypothetical protein ABSF47_01520 [Minisyncoccia bacterium]|jgi:hypothetical protein
MLDIINFLIALFGFLWIVSFILVALSGIGLLGLALFSYITDADFRKIMKQVPVNLRDFCFPISLGRT